MTDLPTTSLQAPLALVLGATGGLGGALAEALLQRGYRVRAMHRAPDKQRLMRPRYEWVSGDAMISGDVLRAAEGASVIVHGVNPPGYQNWGELVLPMIDNTIAAAHAVGARILMPGTIYNFGADTFPLLKEDSRQAPQTVKGKIRVELEQRLEQAAGEGVPVIIVRAGDFFGPDAGNNWFAQSLVQPGKPVRFALNPGRKGVGHAWAYLPDVAETFIRLLDRADELPRFARFHMDGHYDHDGMQMVRAIGRAVGRPYILSFGFPWRLAGLARAFVPLIKELHEMRYLWRETIRLDNGALRGFLGEEPHTPIDHAVMVTLESLGCLPNPGTMTASEGARLMAEGGR
ncbi:NAD(P)H-binding protein [Rhizobium rhizophilum]|uniref:NAD-dependent epimerase/dehydratase family protein n=1 Tax=Rhizobium rhizophilum TaxID=1850373 RepID=A0ABY2QYA2_9HYPH|nr:NAD(P)H-binding protein [Rhizobium rhizophilum]THV15702.1 NAD-dependent epimerase/dehydratase family protein [Rhizobium rhizophilum]